MNALLPVANNFVVVNGEVFADDIKKRFSILDWCFLQNTIVNNTELIRVSFDGMGKDGTGIHITKMCSILRNIKALFITQKVYGKPYCPRMASSRDASCPRCKHAVLFEVFCSRHKEFGGKVMF